MAATLKSLALHGQSSTIYTLKTEKHILYILYYIICTVGTESIQTPLNFSLFVILQPFAKII